MVSPSGTLKPVGFTARTWGSEWVQVRFIQSSRPLPVASASQNGEGTGSPLSPVSFLPPLPPLLASQPSLYFLSSRLLSLMTLPQQGWRARPGRRRQNWLFTKAIQVPPPPSASLPCPAPSAPEAWPLRRTFRPPRPHMSDAPVAEKRRVVHDDRGDPSGWEHPPPRDFFSKGFYPERRETLALDQMQVQVSLLFGLSWGCPLPDPLSVPARLHTGSELFGEAVCGGRAVLQPSAMLGDRGHEGSQSLRTMVGKRSLFSLV